MKIIIWLALLILDVAYARDNCSVLEIEGWVRQKGHELHLVMAEKTMSEKSIPSHMLEEVKLSPFVNQFVIVRAEVDEKNITNIKKLFRIIDVKRGVPDPLNQNASTVSRLLKESKCSP